MKIKKIFAALAAAAVSAVSFASMTFSTASAADVVAIAGLRGQAGTYNYWKPESCSSNITVKDAEIDGNAQYEATWDITGDGTGSIEFLILEFQAASGSEFTADVYPDLSLTVDEVYVDGVEYAFTQNDAAINLKYYEGNTGRVRAYLTDTWNINAGGTLGLASDQAVTSQVKVVFTVGGLYNDGTSNVTETVPPASDAPTDAPTDAPEDGNDPTDAPTDAPEDGEDPTDAPKDEAEGTTTTTTADDDKKDDDKKDDSKSTTTAKKDTSNKKTTTKAASNGGSDEKSADTGDAGTGIALAALALAGTAAVVSRKRK